ncbi:hypothetical protein [Antrihabitans stalactiti]|uniref:ANTAR domain-containing protein n=1 Tax=Antrihabitans stalactiti TaxID=2584121 RepID=A0A848KMK1_9NOCA|nr:hypothetical protein [Antrihabitans stalactiti]NMN99096.1 hypothetical protein [Antrihabitans stalactiti]
MTTTRRHICDQVRASPRVVAAVDVLIDLTGDDADDALCELLDIANRTQLDVVDLADALLALTAQKTPDDRSAESWIVGEVWGRLVQQRQHPSGTEAPPPSNSNALHLDDTAALAIPAATRSRVPTDG